MPLSPTYLSFGTTGNTTNDNNHEGTFDCGTVANGDLLILLAGGTKDDQQTSGAWTTPTKSSGTATVAAAQSIADATGTDGLSNASQAAVQAWRMQVTGSGTLVLAFGDTLPGYGCDFHVIKYAAGTWDTTTPVTGAVIAVNLYTGSRKTAFASATATLGAAPASDDDTIVFTNSDTDASTGKGWATGDAAIVEQGESVASNNYCMTWLGKRNGSTSTTVTWPTHDDAPNTYSLAGLAFNVKAAPPTLTQVIVGNSATAFGTGTYTTPSGTVTTGKRLLIRVAGFTQSANAIPGSITVAKGSGTATIGTVSASPLGVVGNGYTGDYRPFVAYYDCAVTSGGTLTLSVSTPGPTNMDVWRVAAYEWTGVDSPFGAKASNGGLNDQGALTLTLDGTPASTSYTVGTVLTSQPGASTISEGSGFTELYDNSANGNTVGEEADFTSPGTTVTWTDLCVGGTMDAAGWVAVGIELKTVATGDPKSLSDSGTGTDSLSIIEATEKALADLGLGLDLPLALLSVVTEVGTSLGANNAISLPAGSAAGDLILHLVGHDNPSTTAITASTGWTTLNPQTQGTNVVKGEIVARVLDGGANDTCTISGATQDYVVTTVRIRAGYHTVSNVASDIQHAGAVAGSAGNANPPSVTPSATRTYWAFTFGIIDATTSNSFSAVPAGYAPVLLSTSSASSTSSVVTSLGAKRAALTSGVAEDPGTFTNSSRVWIAYTILVPLADWSGRALNDAGAGTDGSLNVDQGGSPSVTDAGTGADSLSVQANVPLADAGAGADSLALSGSFPVADAGSGTDSLAVQPTAGVSDAGAGADSLSVVVYINLSDSGTGTDALSVPAAGLPYAASIHAGGRYLLDQNGNPWPCLGDAGWEPTNLSEADQDTYLDRLQALGFNATFAEFAVGHYKPAGWDPGDNFYGENAWTGTPFASALNSAYVNRFRRFVQAAADRGITVFVFPAYLGWGGDGWVSNGLSGVSNANCRDYGQRLATALAGLPNIVWMIGGDRGGTSTLGATEKEQSNQIALGIRDIDSTRLMGGHTADETTSDAQWGDLSWLQLNGTYWINESSYVTDNLLGWTDTPARPTFFMETKYWHDTTRNPVATLQSLRYAFFGAVCTGAFGMVTGSADIWGFGSGYGSDGGSWQQALGLNTPGTHDDHHVQFGGVLGGFMDSYWANLAPTSPDTTDALLTAGEGTGSTRAAARYGVNGHGLLYMPTARSVTLNLGVFTGTSAVTIKRYDPTTGATTTLGTYATSGSQTITSQGNNASGDSDWLFVIEPSAAAPVTVDLTPATLTIAGQSFPVVAGAASVALNPATLTIAGQSFPVVAGAASVALSPATFALAAQPFAIEAGAASAALTPAEFAIAGQPFPIVAGAASVALAPAGFVISGQPLDVALTAATVALTPAQFGLGATGFQVVLAPLSVPLTPASLLIEAQQFGVGDGILVALGVASFSLAGVPFGVQASSLSIPLAPASMTVAAQSLVVVTDPLEVALGIAGVSITNGTLVPFLSATNLTLVPASFDIAALPFGIELDPLLVELVPATVLLEGVPFLVYIVGERTPPTGRLTVIGPTGRAVVRGEHGGAFVIGSDGKVRVL